MTTACFLLFTEAGRGHHLEVELIAGGKSILKKNPTNTLLLNNTHMEELSIAHHKYMYSSTKSKYGKYIRAWQISQMEGVRRSLGGSMLLEGKLLEVKSLSFSIAFLFFST